MVISRAAGLAARARHELSAVFANDVTGLVGAAVDTDQGMGEGMNCGPSSRQRDDTGKNRA